MSETKKEVVEVKIIRPEGYRKMRDKVKRSRKARREMMKLRKMRGERVRNYGN